MSSSLLAHSRWACCAKCCASITHPRCWSWWFWELNVCRRSKLRASFVLSKRVSPQPLSAYWCSTSYYKVGWVSLLLPIKYHRACTWIDSWHVVFGEVRLCWWVVHWVRTKEYSIWSRLLLSRSLELCALGFITSCDAPSSYELHFVRPSAPINRTKLGLQGVW